MIDLTPLRLGHIESMLNEIDLRLERIESMLNDHINVDPRTLRSGAGMGTALYICNDGRLSFNSIWNVIDNDKGRFLRLDLRDPSGTPIIEKQWKAVYRNHMTGEVIDKP